MASYKLGKLKNFSRLSCKWENLKSSAEQQHISTSTLILRGIGYRAFVTTNDLLVQTALNPAYVESARPVYTGDSVLPAQDLSIAARAEFYASRYLVLRAGHTRDLCIPLRNVAVYLTAKKDRKFVVASPNAVEALAFAKRVYNYRPPSAYTGRGVRVKHAKPARKAGKKDKQRGRAF